MKRKRHTAEEIIGIPREADGGVEKVLREHNISTAIFCRLKRNSRQRMDADPPAKGKAHAPCGAKALPPPLTTNRRPRRRARGGPRRGAGRCGG